MKKLLLTAIFVLPLICFSQKIKISELDKFTKSYRIQTNKLWLKNGLQKGLSFEIRSEGQTILFGISGYGYVRAGVGEGDEILFLLEDGNVVKIASKGMQLTRRNSSNELFDFEYIANIEAVELLSKSTVTSIRIYSYSVYKDDDMPATASEKINQLCKVFLEEYKLKVTD